MPGVGDDHVVAFAGMVFRYLNGDEAGRAEAARYGLSVGCPAGKLDWTEYRQEKPCAAPWPDQHRRLRFLRRR